MKPGDRLELKWHWSHPFGGGDHFDPIEILHVCTVKAPEGSGSFIAWKELELAIFVWTGGPNRGSIDMRSTAKMETRPR